MHNRSAWKLHSIQGWFWGMIQVDIAAEKASYLISHEHDAEQGATWLKMWWVFFSRLWPLVWFVAQLQKLFYLYKGVTTQISSAAWLLSIGLLFVSSLELSWIYCSSLFLSEKWSIGALSCLLFGIQSKIQCNCTLYISFNVNEIAVFKRAAFYFYQTFITFHF